MVRNRLWLIADVERDSRILLAESDRRVEQGEVRIAHDNRRDRIEAIEMERVGRIGFAPERGGAEVDSGGCCRLVDDGRRNALRARRKSECSNEDYNGRSVHTW